MGASDVACLAIAFDDNGDPMKDVFDDDDFREAVRLLVTIVDAEADPE